MIDISLIVFGSILSLLGFLGCFLPVIPGPPLNYVGILLLHFTSSYSFSNRFLLVWLGIVLVVTALDYLIPILGTKKYGGTKYGVWGSTIGLVAGFFIFPPIGILLGPLVGAFIGEMISGQAGDRAAKSALGALVGLLFGTLFKVIASGMMVYYFVAELV